MKTLNCSAIRCRQHPEHTVLAVAARASELQLFAAIERVGRDETGKLNGFQRPQIAGHISEIRDYLDKPEAILPNPIVVAFTRGISVDKEDKTGRCRVRIDVSNGPADRKSVVQGTSVVRTCSCRWWPYTQQNKTKTLSTS